MLERNNEIPVKHPCNQSNLSVRLVFDVLTPRPHFILVQQEEHRKLHPTEHEIRDLFLLVTEFLTVQSQYDNNTILSFHRGKWYQQHEKIFHAHLCVPKKPYCEEAKRMITGEATRQRWPSSISYLNRLEQDAVKSKHRYTEYRDRCLALAYQCLNSPIAYCVPLEQFNTSQFSLVFLTATPRIGIRTKNAQVDLKVLYHFMNHFYLSAKRKLSAVDRQYHNLGAHLCMHVSGNKKKKSRLVERSRRAFIHTTEQIEVVRLVGYVQMDEQLYLRWLPAAYQSIWLDEFAKSSHLVLT